MNDAPTRQQVVLAGRRNGKMSLVVNHLLASAREQKMGSWRRTETRPTPSYVPVSTTQSGQAYLMDTTTKQIRRRTPKAFRSKKERTRARRRAAKVQGW